MPRGRERRHRERKPLADAPSRADMQPVRCEHCGSWVLRWRADELTVHGERRTVSQVVVRDGVKAYAREDGVGRDGGDVHRGRCSKCGTPFRWVDPHRRSHFLLIAAWIEHVARRRRDA